MPLTDSTALYRNKENIMTPDRVKGMALEQKMQQPMKSSVKEIKDAVSKFFSFLLLKCIKIFALCPC